MTRMVSKYEPLVANAGGSSSSMAGEVVTTLGVGLDDVSVSKLRQACAQRRASVHEARVRATSTLSTTILRATISLVEHEGAFFSVRWEDPSANKCRPIPLDKYNRIMYKVPFMIPVISVLCCRLVVLRHHMWCPDDATGSKGQQWDTGNCAYVVPMSRLRGFSWRKRLTDSGRALLAASGVRTGFHPTRAQTIAGDLQQLNLRGFACFCCHDSGAFASPDLK